MNILVINSGSSSLKFQLYQAGTRQKKFTVLCKGIVDGIGLKTCEFRMENGAKSRTQNMACENHERALEFILSAVIKEKILNSLNDIHAIGHRVVHGGEQYRDSVRITPKTIATIQKLAELAPLHNPPNLKGILACKKLLKKAPQIAVFDTAFHETLPEKAFIYALPYELYTRHGIRRYGFHGTSHKYVSEQAAKILKKKNLKIVSCHLGNGSSVAAIMNGKSVDTSMGLTPLEGLPMGTRSGDIDPAIIFHLLKQHKKTPEQIETMLIKEAGLKGISGISSDVRILLSSVRKRNKRAELTFEVLCYRIAKYIGSYAAAMNGLDAIIFTAGIGEHAYYLRSDICKYLGFLGVKIDEQKNKKNAMVISAKTSTIKVLVIPTNEEEAIANETLRVLK